MKHPYSSADQEKLSAVMAILEKEYKSHHTTEQLARRVHTNEHKLKQIFKHSYARGIHACHVHIRIEKAKGLLLGTELSVIQIAGQVGFRVTRNFNRNFRKLTGCSPREWKKQQAHSNELAATSTGSHL
jgi:transcriptional regulator GlxA family with amidase domain